MLLRMKKYETLKAFLGENLLSGGPGDFDFTAPYRSFRSSIKHNSVSVSNVRELVENAIKSPQFSWWSLALESPDFIPTDFILSPPDGFEVTEEDIFNYFKMLTWDILYPERHLEPLQKEELRRSIYYLLKDASKSSSDWFSVEFILHELQNLKPEWASLEYYNIQLLFEAYRGEELIEVQWKCLLQISHMRINPTPDIEKYLDDLIKDDIEPFCLLPVFHWPMQD